MKIYIYGLYDPRDGLLRYVGKTFRLKIRLLDHILVAKRNGSSEKDKWILELISLNLEPELKVLEESNERDWEAVEKKWIASARIAGTHLLNVSDGGADPPDWGGRKQTEEHIRRRVESRLAKDSYKHSPEAIAKMKESKKGKGVGTANPFYGKKHSEESLKKMSKVHSGQPAWNKGIPCSEEVKQAISAKNSGRRPSEETRKKLSAVHKGRKLSPEHAEKLRAVNLGKQHSEETKEKIRQVRLGTHQTEEAKQKLREYFTGRFVSEETRQKLSQSRKGKKMTPEQLAKRKDAQQRLWQDPEYRARMLEAQRRRREREAEEKAESQTNP